MKELTEEEFSDRMGALSRAGRIFPDVLNITERFKLYQEVFADREREIFISTQLYGDRPRTAMDKYERIPCIDCGKPMMFRIVPENKEGVKTQLVCSGCDLVLDSEKTLEGWIKELKVKDE
uniref:Uncharacterized protein n=1 Tax=viral metagenome TaxID=1070528 RepID=A0A6M3J4E3_9ZZZZ